MITNLFIKIRKCLLDLLPDKLFLMLLFRKNMGYWMDFNNPKSFSEKLQWLKLNNRKNIYTTLVDKYAVKKYVAKIIGDEYIIPTIGVWGSFDQIDFDTLPNQFVLKCTHDSGGLVICKDKSKFDRVYAKKIIEKSLKFNYYKLWREWPYKNVIPRIIAEQYLVDESGIELKDYKFFCFNGIVKCLKVDFGRFVEHHANYYDAEMNLLPFGEANFPPVYDHTISKPKNYEKMVELAEKLSKSIPFLRVDFYNINGKIYFGELTLYPTSGIGQFTSKDWDIKLGSYINLQSI